MVHQSVNSIIRQVFELLGSNGEHCTFVESCTGGMCAEKLTDIPGSSEVFWGGWTVYSNNAKKQLGVSEKTLIKHGAVSRQTVAELAKLGRELSRTDWCISISGIAGPGGGSAEKPVGTVWIGVEGKKSSAAYCFRFAGNRTEVREQACARAFLLLLKYASGRPRTGLSV